MGKFGHKKLETSLYRTAQKVFRYHESFKHEPPVRRTDGQTRRQHMPLYVAPPKI